MPIEANEQLANPTVKKEGEFVLQVREQAKNVESLHNELENLEHILQPYSANEPVDDQQGGGKPQANTDMGQVIDNLEGNIQTIRFRLQKIISEFRG